MTLTRRQLFATLAAAAWAPFLGQPQTAVPLRRIAARVPIKDDAFVAYYRANLHLAVKHPAPVVWITGIELPS
ncbi:MAG: hypothetical protein IT519_11560 [Burkholderiales bacterium]|nr:hypothetical protein [Burkholderiales bacterium]